MSENEPKIGVYVCHCGINIAGVVPISEVVEYAKTLPNVVLAKEYKFYCSDVGQSEIAKDIKDGLIDRVVVAACSPRMHEPTFRKVLISAGLNPFYFVQANIREHASWVSMNDSEGATQIAKDHIRMAVAKARNLKALDIQKVKVMPKTLVIGGGVAGIYASLDLAEQGYEVYLVEKEATIGGHMAQLDKTFPTMDCSACILTPKMVEVAQNPNIHILSYSEVEKVDGFVGNFKVLVRKKAHYVDQDKCTGCGSCAQECPVVCANEFDLGMGYRKAIYIPFPQAIPGQYTIDMEHCIKCGICARPTVCELKAIDFDQKDEYVEFEVGTIIVATGWKPFDPTSLKQYGFGKYPNVITALQFERLLSSVGPTAGKPVRPSDMKAPHSVTFLQCVGSRFFREGGNHYCSRVCCMYAIKQARQYKEKHPEARVYIFYMDIRAFGKGYEEFYEVAGKDYGISFIRGRIGEVSEDENHNIIMRAEDTLLGRPIEMKTDLLVLSVGLEPQLDSDKICQILSIQKSTDGFFLEAHPKLRPVDTLTSGIFVAGVCQSPKDIPDSVGQAKAAATGAAILMAKGEVEVEPYFSVVKNAFCSGCRSCITLCPYGAIEFDETLKRAVINSVLCKGCGTCVAGCPSNAIEQNHFTDEQLMAEIIGALPLPKDVEGGNCFE